MQFSDYLKTCRTQNDLTQEALVEALYLYDIDQFGGLDTTTLSKWERGVTKPRMHKQVAMIRFFQQRMTMAVPCFGSVPEEEVEENICRLGMERIVRESKSRELILNFPSAMMSIDELITYELNGSENIDKATRLNAYLDKNFNQDYTQLSSEDFKRWALIPGNFFLVAEFVDELVGLLFVLKLKPNAFEKIVSGQILERDLAAEDFASPHEKGSSYILSFFAMNERAASMLFVRYYAHVIAHQTTIEDVRVATMQEDAGGLIEHLDLPLYHEMRLANGRVLQFFRTSLANFLATERVVRMILSPQDCPEE
jgi:transcriptional regulator with XRE-family HTH domain